MRSLFFGDFANPDSNLRNYDEITDEVGLKSTMDSYLEEYNQMSTAPMSLANRVLDRGRFFIILATGTSSLRFRNETRSK